MELLGAVRGLGAESGSFLDRCPMTTTPNLSIPEITKEKNSIIDGEIGPKSVVTSSQ
jgi:hypothetical protein